MYFAEKCEQFCIVPALSFEPDYETGRAVRWDIAAASVRQRGLAETREYKQDQPSHLVVEGSLDTPTDLL